MKKLWSCFMVALLLLFVAIASAEEAVDLSKMTDKQLSELAKRVEAETAKRGLSPSSDINLTVGSYTIGKDILPGRYVIKCLRVDSDEKLAEKYDESAAKYMSDGHQSLATMDAEQAAKARNPKLEVIVIDAKGNNLIVRNIGINESTELLLEDGMIGALLAVNGGSGSMTKKD